MPYCKVRTFAVRLLISIFSQASFDSADDWESVDHVVRVSVIIDIDVNMAIAEKAIVIGLMTLALGSWRFGLRLCGFWLLAFDC